MALIGKTFRTSDKARSGIFTANVAFFNLFYLDIVINLQFTSTSWDGFDTPLLIVDQLNQSSKDIIKGSTVRVASSAVCPFTVFCGYFWSHSYYCVQNLNKKYPD